MHLSPSRRRRLAAALAGAVAAGLLLSPHHAPGVAAAGWSPGGTFPALAQGRIWQVAIDPADPNSAVAATDAGVYRSADGGQTWSATALRGTRVWTVGYDARGGHRVLAGLDQGGGIRRSDDGGATWVDASAGLQDRTVRALAFGLAGVVAGTRDGVALSADGSTWNPLGLEGYDISSLAVAANAPTLVVVAGSDGGQGASAGFLFRNSGPQGAWETLTQGLPATAVTNWVAAGPRAQATQTRPLLVATNKGAFRSGDGGTTWTPCSGVPDKPAAVTLTTATFSPVDPMLVYAGSDAAGSSGGAMLRSTDGGTTFQVFQEGLADTRTNVASLAVSPTEPPLVMAAVNPPAETPIVYQQTDATAPAPAPTLAESGAAVPSVTARPSSHATPRPPVRPAVVPSSPSPLRRLVDWPFPLALEVLVALGVLWFLMRRRQKRLEIEGPP